MTKQLCRGFPLLMVPLVVAGCDILSQAREESTGSPQGVQGRALVAPHAASATLDNVAVTLPSSLPFDELSESPRERICRNRK